MAPLAMKRALPPDPPDARNRVSKPKAMLCGAGIETKSVRLTPYSTEAHRKAKEIERALNKVQSSAEGINTFLDYPSDESMSEDTDSVFNETHQESLMDHAKIKANSTHENVLSPTECDTIEDQRSSAPITNAIKGLLDFTNDYLQNLEINHLRVGADFLALLADGASRAMR
ncbi:hypothetical protein K3495_g3846 [Podosphaera aphanis]|nr:hypothetical protein K3495_g3846 [Podosphaera aphanis]